MDNIKIGKYISEKRKLQGLTQKDLAEKLNMSDKSVSKWERGVCLPDVSVYQDLCSILGISINEFIAGEDIQSDRVVEKGDENIMKVLKVNIKKISQLKILAAFLAVILILSLMVLGHSLNKKSSVLQNVLIPVDRDSSEYSAIGLVLNNPMASLVKYETPTEVDSIKVYMYEYRYGELISKNIAAEIDNCKESGAERSGMVFFLADWESKSMRVGLTAAGLKAATITEILGDVDSFDGFIRSGYSLEDNKGIVIGSEMPIFTLYFGDNVCVYPLSHIEEGLIPKDNMYSYVFTIEFDK